MSVSVSLMYVSDRISQNPHDQMLQKLCFASKTKHKLNINKTYQDLTGRGC